ncbi:MAG TPA: response regulator transcription factor [Dehalococcoidia bacterium]|nr:response regulator transcription factor [Dehalococcoidia bacterium]
MATDPQYRVLLVDDHEIVRRGLKTVLQERPDITVIGEAGTMKGGIEETMRLQPDIVIMDLRLPDGSGVEACRDIRSQAPDIKVIILTSYADEDALFAAIMAGAAGYVLKDLDPSRLQEAIATVGRGGSLLDPKMATTVLERLRKGSTKHPADDAFSSLSPQEDRILSFIGEGLTNREIANELSLSEKTIKNYVSQIYSKLHVERRSQAATIATERRLRKQQ